MQAYFEEIDSHLWRELYKAARSVKICVAWLNLGRHRDVFEVLLNRGVSVEIMCNDDNKNYETINNNSLDVKIYPIKGWRKTDLMHHKFCVIDEEVVVTGSYNWSKGAARHFENVVIVKEDFRLVKSFLHEFEDLKNYYLDFSQSERSKIICGCVGFSGWRCRSTAYHLGIIGYESGIYEESEIGIYKICSLHCHVEKITVTSGNYILTHLGLKDEGDDCDEYYGKYEMRRDFAREREITANFQSYFAGLHNGLKIHGVGAVVVLNEMEHLEYGEDQEHGVSLIWRDTYYRKVIPASIPNHSNMLEIYRNHG
ncbi:phospholipase D-like domain-containing protein [Burkholderia lata]|uniref:phospholipase D-like domain-containing protein n=1 Tax=Burkholderia lata (strain ATCC 17760 / DSM 23089 / LMG 22485 / NCIMB 9086 / R18194 / 383) TaxID=482957 RepID=UPI0020C66252|nr:phospholipase D-like domain-containing protein [Burkholderia lata]